MNNKNIIIALLVIVIIVLAAVIGVMSMHSITAKQDSKITITSNNTLYSGDNLTFKLTDLNKTPIKKASVNVTLKDKDGKVVVDETLKTNSKGKANLKLDLDNGNYTVNVTFAGNDNFTANSTSQKLKIEEKAVDEPVESQQSSESYAEESSSSSQNDYRPAVDSGGVTREEADYWGWQYTPEHGGHYHGSRDAWDEKAGVYHD